jgi:hypothetical protein
MGKEKAKAKRAAKKKREQLGVERPSDEDVPLAGPEKGARKAGWLVVVVRLPTELGRPPPDGIIIVIIVDTWIANKWQIIKMLAAACRRCRT